MRPVLAGFVLTCALLAQSSSTLADAKRLMSNQEKRGQAEPALRNLLKSEPENSEALLLLGILLEEQLQGNAPALAAQVEPLYRKALAVRELTPDQSAELALALEVYSRLLNAIDRSSESYSMAARATKLRREILESKIERAEDQRLAARIGGGVSAPVPIFKVEPEYSEFGRFAGTQGTVLCSIVVAADGSVTEIRLKRSLGFGLDEKAVEALRQWRFKPGLREGKPVPVQANVEMNFRLL